MKRTRYGKLIIVVGARGSGKTTYMERLFKGRSNLLVYQLFIDDRYKGAQKELYSKFEIGRQLVGKTIIIEDSTQLIGSNPKNDIRKLAVSCKQLGSDCIFIFHSFNVIPPYLLALFDYIIVFECAEVKKTNSLLEYYDEIIKLQKKKVVKYKPLGIIEAH